MSSGQREAYRQRLLGRWRRIEQDRAQLTEEARQGVGGEASGGLSDVPTPLADLGSHASEEELTLGLLGNEDQLLRESHEALARIEQGTFGICEGCHRSIPRERRVALPYARRCVRCASAIRPVA